MRKRTVIICLNCLVVVALSMVFAGTTDNFTKTKIYQAQMFADVPENAWYANSVVTAYEYNLIHGKGDARFDPDGTLTWAEAIKLASSIRAIYEDGNVDGLSANPNDAWYKVYADYALSHSMIASTEINYSSPITRLEFADLFASVFPEGGLKEINTVEDNAIPDIPVTSIKGDSVYSLYRSGILTGSDVQGNFFPNSTIKRSEVATIAVRMVKPTLRKAILLTNAKPIPATMNELNAAQISEKCSDAVFYIEVFDQYDKPFATGSGFFINSSGLAVTNYHVLKGASHAKITTTSGKTYAIKSIEGYDVNQDVALIKVDGKDFEFLTIDHTPITMGQKIYAIGSPEGLDNTISQGIISNVSRAFDNLKYIQITAPISSGSSGGALINSSGEAVGITTAIYSEGQNLNFALPITVVDALDKSSSKTIAEVTDYEHKQLLKSLRLVYPYNMICMRDTVSFLYFEEDLANGSAFDFRYIGDASKYLKVKFDAYVTESPLKTRYVYVETSKPGTYQLEFYLVDKKGNRTDISQTITIVVLDKAPKLKDFDVPDFAAIVGAKLISKEDTSSVKGYKTLKYVYDVSSFTKEEKIDKVFSFENVLMDHGFNVYQSEDAYTIYKQSDGVTTRVLEINIEEISTGKVTISVTR